MRGEDRGPVGSHGERGQVVPLMAAVLVVAGAFAIGVVHVAIVAAERARAQSAADAAALAGAADGRAAGATAAAANGAALVGWREAGDDVVVRVRYRRATARARARLVADVLAETRWSAGAPRQRAENVKGVP